MVGAIANKIENGEVQLFCVDSVDAESWYNRNVPPRWKIARQVQYDEYIVHEVIPLVKQLNWSPHAGGDWVQLRRISRGDDGSAASGCVYGVFVDERGF